MGSVAIYTLLTILCFACYYHALDGDFVFDDSVTILKNRGVTTVPTNYTAIFKNDYWGTPLVNKDSHKSYRPFTTLMFHMEYAKYKFQPKQMKLINLVLHCLNTILFNRVLNQFSFGEYSTHQMATLASVIFALHPIHTEAVSAIVGRADLMFSLFYLKALLITTMKKKFSELTEFMFVIAFTTIGLFYKETAVTIPLACVFADYMKKRILYKTFQEQKAFIFKLRNIAYIVHVMTLIWFRIWLQDFDSPIFKQMDNPVAFNESFLTRLLSQNYLYVMNIWIMIFPLWLSFDWALGCITLINSIWDLRLQAVICMHGCILLALANFKRSYNIILGLGFLVIPFLPASGILKVGFVIAERVLYVPSLGFCLLLSYSYLYLIKKFRKNSVVYNMLRTSIGIVLLCYFMRTRQRAIEWQKEETLYSSALNVCPNNAKVHYNIARLATDHNDKDKALKHYHIAINLYPDYEAALMNLGNLYRDKGEFKTAEKYLKASIKAFSEFPTAWMNLGIVQAAMKRYDEALQSYQQALKLRKNYAVCYYNMGNLFLEQNRDLEAIHHWQYAVHLDPKQGKAWSNILTMLDSKGLLEDALRMSERALYHLREDTNLMFLRANVLGKMKKYMEAESLYIQAIELEPNNSLYCTNLGVLYHRWGKLDAARILYRRAIQLNPNDSQTAKESLTKILIRIGHIKVKKEDDNLDEIEVDGEF